MPIGINKVSRNSQIGSDIPDSVIHQYPVSTFGSPWSDDIGSANMTVNGLSTSTFSNSESSVLGEKSNNDYGLANGPETLFSQEQWGIAFTIEWGSVTDPDMVMAAEDSTGERFHIRAGDSTGEFELNLGTSSRTSALVVATDTTNGFDDRESHAVVINKNGDDRADIDFYVDDMTTAKQTSSSGDNKFDNTADSMSSDMGFYARNKAGSQDNYANFDAGIFEFNESPYTQSERDAFVTRRLEV